MLVESSAESVRHPAGLLREAAQTDATLRADLRRTYPGRHDVLDALWWRAHPLTQSPAGRPDPAAELPLLQAAVYSRARSAESASDDDERLAALQRALEQDTADLDYLLEQHATLATAVTDAPANAPAHGPGPGPGPLPPARVHNLPSSVPHKSVFRTLAGTRAGTVLLLAVGAAGAAAGVIALLTLQASGLAGATDAPGGIAPAAGVSATAEPSASADTLLAVFDGPEFVPDETTPALGGEYTAVHSIFGPTLETGLPYSVFAARLRDDQYCLVLRNADLTGTSVCTTLEDLTRSGLHLKATIMGSLDTAGPLTAAVTYDQLIDMSVDWTVAGGMSSTSGPHRGAAG